MELNDRNIEKVWGYDGENIIWISDNLRWDIGITINTNYSRECANAYDYKVFIRGLTSRNYPIRYADGRIAYDDTYVPRYVKKKFEQIFKDIDSFHANIFASPCTDRIMKLIE